MLDHPERAIRSAGRPIWEEKDLSGKSCTTWLQSTLRFSSDSISTLILINANIKQRWCSSSSSLRCHWQLHGQILRTLTQILLRNVVLLQQSRLQTSTLAVTTAVSGQFLIREFDQMSIVTDEVIVDHVQASPKISSST